MQPLRPQVLASADDSNELEQALQNVLDAYQTIDALERPKKLRRIMEILPESDKTVMLELGSAFSCNASSPLTSPVQFQLTPSSDESSEYEADDLAQSFSESPSNDMFDPCMYLQEESGTNYE